MLVNSSFVRNERAYSVSYRAILYYVFLIFVFFPYLQLMPTGTDMQPYAVLSAIGLFFLFKKRLAPVEVWLFFMLLSSVLLLATGPMNFTVFRSFLNYVSLFFIAYISYRVLRSGKINIDRFILITFSIWFLVSLMQTIYDSEFLTFLVSASRTTENRGVTGLAPEPTFLGIVFVFYILFALHLSKLNYRKWIIVLSVFGILFLAKSSMALLFIIIMLGLYFLTHANFKSLVFLILGLVSFTYLISFLEGTRIYHLYDLVKTEPSSLLLVDASVNDRFFHMYFSVKGFLENFLMPNGYHSWLFYVNNQLPAYQDFVIVEWFSLGGRIMSGYGGAFFELGVFFFAIPFGLIYLLWKVYKGNLKKFLFFALFVNIIMFSAIPTGFALFAFYLGFLTFLNYKNNQVFAK